MAALHYVGLCTRLAVSSELNPGLEFFIQGTTKRAEAGIRYTCVIEQHTAGRFPLPNGLVVGATCVNVDHRRVVPLQFANFGDEDVYLQPRMVLGTVQPASIEADILESAHNEEVDGEDCQVLRRIRLEISCHR